MVFTINDYKKIQLWLQNNSIKDTQFKLAEDSLDGSETVALVQKGKNVRMLLSTFIEQVGNLKFEIVDNIDKVTNKGVFYLIPLTEDKSSTDKKYSVYIYDEESQSPELISAGIATKDSFGYISKEDKLFVDTLRENLNGDSQIFTSEGSDPFYSEMTDNGFTISYSCKDPISLNGSEGTIEIPMVSSTTNGLLSKEDFIKLLNTSAAYATLGVGKFYIVDFVGTSSEFEKQDNGKVGLIIDRVGTTGTASIKYKTNSNIITLEPNVIGKPIYIIRNTATNIAAGELSEIIRVLNSNIGPITAKYALSGRALNIGTETTESQQVPVNVVTDVSTINGTINVQTTNTDYMAIPKQDIKDILTINGF